MCRGRKVTCAVETVYGVCVLGVKWERPHRVYECPTFTITQLPSGGDCGHACDRVGVGCGGCAFLASTWQTRPQRLYPRCWSYDLQCQVCYPAQTADFHTKKHYKQIFVWVLMIVLMIVQLYLSWPLLLCTSTLSPLGISVATQKDSISF